MELRPFGKAAKICAYIRVCSLVYKPRGLHNLVNDWKALYSMGLKHETLQCTLQLFMTETWAYQCRSQAGGGGGGGGGLMLWASSKPPVWSRRFVAKFL